MDSCCSQAYIMKDKRYYQFKTNKKQGIITHAKGIQFIEQELNVAYDDTSFQTLKAADEAGHMNTLKKCFPSWGIVKQLAALPDKFKVSELASIIQQARELINE